MGHTMLRLLVYSNKGKGTPMAKSISAMNRKRRKDKAVVYKAGKAPKKHKVAVERSKKAKKKLAYRAA
jgi:hypothetical protein